MLPFGFMMMPVLADVLGIVIRFLPIFLFSALIAKLILTVCSGGDNDLRGKWEQAKEKCCSTAHSVRQQIKQACNSTRIPTDVFEKDDSFVIEMDLPGMKKEDIKVEVEENRVTISGERTAEETDHRISSRQFGAFSKTICLPETADMETMMAKYENGVLALIVNKKVEYQNRRKNIVIGFSVCFTLSLCCHSSVILFLASATSYANWFFCIPCVDYQESSTTERAV